MAAFEELGRGFRFDKSSDRWLPVPAREGAAEPPPGSDLGSPRHIRVATFNVLTSNAGGDAYLHHDVRYDHIVGKLLPALDADVIGLNEVTRSMLERLQAAPWVRSSYILSMITEAPECAYIGVDARAGGCVLLSRMLPLRSEHLKPTPTHRHFPIMTLRLPTAATVAVASVHLKSLPWWNESRRQVELREVTAALEDRGRGLDACIIMGDHNFHREEENASIPASWHEIPAVVALGVTWDHAANAMLPHMLPLRHIYNGFGFGTGWFFSNFMPVWPSQMRLDRVLVKNCDEEGTNEAIVLAPEAATARLFANELVDSQAKRRGPPLPLSGPELERQHRALPSREYLFPSDHFGIVTTIPLLQKRKV